MTTRSQRLDSVADIYMGQAPSGEAYNSEGEGWPLLAGAGDFKDGLPSAKKFTREAPRTCVPGDIVIGVRASIGDKVIADREYCLGRGVAGLRPRSGLHNRYLWHWLSVTRQKLEGKGKGATFKQVTKEDVAELEIPLPPLEEQRRIAAILDKSQGVLNLAALAGRLAATLIESELIRRFGRPGEPCAGAEMLSLVDAGVNVIDCPHSTPKWTEQGKVCLRTSNLGQGCWVWDDTRRISNDDFLDRSRRALLEPGDIVLSREGTVGIAAIVQPEMEVCMGQRLVQLKLDTVKLAPEFLLAQLLYLLTPERISHVMTGSTSKHINVKDLRQLRIFCPPIEDQLAFQDFCVSSRSLHSRMGKLRSKSAALSRSIQARYFFP
jgi:type I restriction enzyme S subunit